MMTADNIAYALQRDLNLFVLLQHIVHLFQRRKRCEGSAYKFFFICLLSVDLRELIDDPSAVQNLTYSSSSLMNEKLVSDRICYC